MQAILSKSEAMLLVALLAVATAALAGPPLALSPDEQGFLADDRVLWGVMYALDVYSTLPFALAGAAGLVALWFAPQRRTTNMQRAMLLLFLGGLCVQAIGSAAYHLDPDAAGLAAARFCTSLSFAGLLGLAVAGHVSERAGAAVGLIALAGGIACVKCWSETGNVLPWAVVQVAGLMVLWWAATLHPRMQALPVNWSLVLLAHGAARLLEINDYAIYELAQHIVSGQTLSNIVASAAAWPVIAALAGPGRSVQNAVDAELAEDGAIRWSNA